MALITASSINYDLRTQDRVLGYYVYDPSDRDIGDIRELLVDEKSRKPRYALIEIGGIMAIKGKKIPIPWSALEKGGMSRMDIKLMEEEIIAAPTPFDPLNPTRVEEESLHYHFHVDPYWFDSEGEDQTQPGTLKPKDGIDIPDKLELENNDKQ